MNAKNLLDRSASVSLLLIRSTRVRHIIIASMLASFLTVCGARAQTAEDLVRIKEEIKQELLKELRSGLLAPEIPGDNFQKMKEALKKEILQELRKEIQADKQANERAAQKLKNELQRELLKQIRKDSVPEHPQAVHRPAHNIGNVEGRMLRRGIGLAGCQVKLVQLLSTGTKFATPTKGQEFVTTTARDGSFKFESLPVGDYKIKWLLPGDTGWIRRLRDKPDVRVITGQSNMMKAIETARPLLSQ